ncbi:MAG: Re/Si-specific NAD(P)(+) transhydrogenase subunit alpha [Myxococcota bacterium]|nr:Re/Si-specific NAD(P)(+) transhydrogenase subunit alpha [Myxococcota bacterium]
MSLVPETIKKLIARKHTVAVQAGAGFKSAATDADYLAAGAQLVPDAQTLFSTSEVVVKVQAPTDQELAWMKEGTTLVSYLYPLSNRPLLEKLAARKLSALAVDSIPRTTLAQMMDVLSSQATLAGYRSVILAAEACPKLFPMLMTAAGTLPAGKVIVLGAGVAGLQAIATARRLGAVVEAFDVRRVAKEQVESLGARFVEVDSTEDAQTAGGYAKEVSEEYKAKQAALLQERIARADACITTAQIPGKRAPILVTAQMVHAMKPGSVVVDIAAEQGGNCELTRPGERYLTEGGVTVVGELNLPARMSIHASLMFSRNMEKLLGHLVGKEGTALNLSAPDEITRGVVTLRHGELVDPRLVPAVPSPEAKP